MVKVSVIVKTLNEGAYVKRCLESLKQQNFKDFEVIVVDSGSSDKTVEVAQKMGARVLHEPRFGVSVACNFGAEEAKGELLAFTDADTLHPLSWLEKIVKDFSDPQVACVFGPVKPLGAGLHHKLLFFLSTNLAARIAYSFGFMLAHGANESFRRDAFRKAGGYDERLNVLEDNELANRIKKFGKVVFDPSVYVLTSIRRVRQEGYLKSTQRFISACINIYVKGKRARVEFPEYR